jgi:hypothetical protein
MAARGIELMGMSSSSAGYPALVLGLYFCSGVPQKQASCLQQYGPVKGNRKDASGKREELSERIGF